MARIIDSFTEKQVKNYSIVDRETAERQMKVRSLALMADALQAWISYATGNILRASTSKRYLESLYIDASDPFSISINVVANTLADIVEYGQNSFYQKAIVSGATSKGKPKYKARPILEGGVDRDYISPKEGYGFLSVSSKGAVGELDSGADPNDVSPRLMMAISGYERVAVSATTFKPAGQFIDKKDPNIKFRVLTPADTWKHPGIRNPVLASDYVASWIKNNRENYTQGMFDTPHIYEW